MEGNQMKMREALELFLEYSELVCKMGMFNRDRLIAITTKARAALSAPPRNCDLYDDAEIACQAWLEDTDNWDEFGSPELELCEWLFASAKKKGECDGK